MVAEPKSQYTDVNDTGGYDKTPNWKSVRELEGLILTYFITESLKMFPIVKAPEISHFYVISIFVNGILIFINCCTEWDIFKF